MKPLLGTSTFYVWSNFHASSADTFYATLVHLWGIRWCFSTVQRPECAHHAKPSWFISTWDTWTKFWRRVFGTCRWDIKIKEFIQTLPVSFQDTNERNFGPHLKELIAAPHSSFFVMLCHLHYREGTENRRDKKHATMFQLCNYHPYFI